MNQEEHFKQVKYTYSDKCPAIFYFKQGWIRGQKELLEELAFFCESEEIVIDEKYLRDKRNKLFE